MSMYYYEVKDSTTYQTQVDDLYDQKVDISYGDQRSAKLSLGDKPVLDDLPLKNLAAKNLEAKNQIQLELLFDKTSVILSEFQEAAKKEFEEVDLKLEDIQNVLGKEFQSRMISKLLVMSSILSQIKQKGLHGLLSRNEVSILIFV
jgi:hypothetical protein